MPKQKTFHVTNRNEAFAYLAYRAARELLGKPIDSEPASMRRYHCRLEQEAIKILKTWDAEMIRHWLREMQLNAPITKIVTEGKPENAVPELPEWAPEKYRPTE
jgi:hypothetical protein